MAKRQSSSISLAGTANAEYFDDVCDVRLHKKDHAEWAENELNADKKSLYFNVDVVCVSQLMFWSSSSSKCENILEKRVKCETHILRKVLSWEPMASIRHWPELQIGNAHENERMKSEITSQFTRNVASASRTLRCLN